MITSKTAQTKDTANWIHGCFMVQVGSAFQTYTQIMKYAQADGSGAADVNGYNSAVSTILNEAATPIGPNGSIYFSKRKCRDSSLGGNDSINPLPQFSLDDDIVPSHLEIPNYGKSSGMGQVYSENYDDNQQILYLGFGIPVFSNVGNFWSGAVDLELAGFVNKGAGISPGKIGYLIGSAPIRIIKIATIPFKFIAAMVDSLQKVPISKYYSFSSQMPMYFRFVNTILVMMSTNMGLMGSSDDFSTTGSDTSGTTATEQLDQNRTQGEDVSGMGSIFTDGLDMARIMTKKFMYENGTNTLKDRYTDQALFEASNLNNADGVGTDQDPNKSTNPDPNVTNSQPTTGTDTPADSSARFWTMGWFDSFAAAYKNAIYDGHLFIGFRVDKGSGASESFSNSTGESQIAQLANSKFQEGRDAAFGSMNGKFGGGNIGETLSSVVSAATDLIKGAAKAFSLDPLAAVMTGAAKIDIPEVWMGSNYSRSASFSLTCLSPYGDLESIFMSEYVPLACLLAGTLPRGTGLSSYSSPFVCQAYCRGIFSSPLCLIESLEVTRGADQFGFTAARLPLKLSIQLTLKDLTPTMYMSMGGDQGIAQAIFGTDDNFGEYMLTLSGMGLRDRLAPFRSIRRKTNILLSTLYKNKLSPFMLGMEGGSRFLVSRVISTIASGGRGLPGN